MNLHAIQQIEHTPENIVINLQYSLTKICIVTFFVNDSKFDNYLVIKNVIFKSNIILYVLYLIT